MHGEGRIRAYEDSCCVTWVWCVYGMAARPLVSEGGSIGDERHCTDRACQSGQRLGCFPLRLRRHGLSREYCNDDQDRRTRFPRLTPLLHRLCHDSHRKRPRFEQAEIPNTSPLFMGAQSRPYFSFRYQRRELFRGGCSGAVLREQTLLVCHGMHLLYIGQACHPMQWAGSSH